MITPGTRVTVLQEIQTTGYLFGPLSHERLATSSMIGGGVVFTSRGSYRRYLAQVVVSLTRSSEA